MDPFIKKILQDTSRKLFNPGWMFGKTNKDTIHYQSDFLQKCKPFLHKRNETIIKWIIPVNIEYGHPRHSLFLLRIFLFIIGLIIVFVQKSKYKTDSDEYKYLGKILL